MRIELTRSKRWAMRRGGSCAALRALRVCCLPHLSRSLDRNCTLQAYNPGYSICTAIRMIGAPMGSYRDLVGSGARKDEIRAFLVDGERVSVTLRIPDTLRDAAKEEAALRGMSFSAFVRTCMIEELSGKGR